MRSIIYYALFSFAHHPKSKSTISLFLQLFIFIQLYGQNTDWNQLIEEWRMAYHVPGMSVGIIKNDEILLSDGFGYLEEGAQTKVDQHTVFAIASNTKAFISAAIATLVEEGKLNWDDPVKKYLPYFELYDPCVSEMITIRDLLCHRAGLGTFSGDVIWYRSTYSAEEVVKRAVEIPQQFQFRNGFGYSNVMYITAGEVIHEVSGKTWAAYVQEQFLDPLLMNRSVTTVMKLASMPNVATPHHPVGEKNQPLPWVKWESSGAAGGIISSADDMLKWIAMQLNQGIAGTDTFFSTGNQLRMWTPYVTFPIGDRTREMYGGRHFNGYGLGWSTTEYEGRRMVSHTGGYDGMYSAVVLLPDERIGIVILTNTMRSIGMNLSYEILDKLLDVPQKEWKEKGIKQDIDYQAGRAERVKVRMDAQTKNTIPTIPVDRIVGLYRCPMYGDIRIEEQGGQLILDFISAPELKARLSHWHYDTYRIEWIESQSWFDFGTVQILKDNNHQPTGLLFDVPNDDIFFEEINAKRVKS